MNREQTGRQTLGIGCILFCLIRLSSGSWCRQDDRLPRGTSNVVPALNCCSTRIDVNTLLLVVEEAHNKYSNSSSKDDSLLQNSAVN
jgi:hypothetical protein